MSIFILVSYSTKIDIGIKLPHVVVRIECFKYGLCVDGL